MDYVDPFADPEVPDRYFLLVEQQQDSTAMDLSVDAEATGNQVLLCGNVHIFSVSFGCLKCEATKNCQLELISCFFVVISFFVPLQSRLTSAASAQQKSALVQIEGYVKGDFIDLLILLVSCAYGVEAMDNTLVE